MEIYGHEIIIFIIENYISLVMNDTYILFYHFHTKVQENEFAIFSGTPCIQLFSIKMNYVTDNVCVRQLVHILLRFKNKFCFSLTIFNFISSQTILV